MEMSKGPQKFYIRTMKGTISFYGTILEAIKKADELSELLVHSQVDILDEDGDCLDESDWKGHHKF